MPPKKKAGAPLKVPKTAPMEDKKPELELPPPELKKIPRKPLFISGNFEGFEEVDGIRVKLWKFRSVTFPKQCFPYRQYYGIKQDSNVKILEMGLKDSTMQKSLRHVKRFSTDPLVLFEMTWHGERIYNEALLASVKMNQLRKMKKIKKAQDKLAKSAPRNIQSIIETPEYFEAFDFSCPDTRIDCLHELSNLQRFELNWSNHAELIENVSFVKQYPMLKALTLRLGMSEIENFDALTDLPYLKEFHLFSRHLQPRPFSTRVLPNLTRLEKLTLSLNGNPLFDVENVKDFINKNRDLKYLGLALTVPDAATVFENDEDFALPEIETLQLELVQLEKPSGTAKIIAETLRNHHSIKELLLKFEQSNSNLNAILFKDGVARMKSLEKLTIDFSGLSGALEDNKFKHLKNIFTNITDLAELNLNLTADVLPAKEISSILDWLNQLKNLKKLTLTAKCFKLTPAADNKLSNFIDSHGYLKVMEIDIEEV